MEHSLGLPTPTTLAVQPTARDTMPHGDSTHRGQGTAPPPFPVYNIETKAAPSIDQSSFETRGGQLSRLQQHFRTTRDSSSPPPMSSIQHKKVKRYNPQHMPTSTPNINSPTAAVSNQMPTSPPAPAPAFRPGTPRVRKDKQQENKKKRDIVRSVTYFSKIESRELEAIPNN